MGHATPRVAVDSHNERRCALESLKDFLEKEVEEQGPASSERERLLSDWVSAVDRLVERLAGWLRANDTKGVLRIEKTTREIQERAVGRYTAPGLRVECFTRKSKSWREFCVEPVALFSIGSMVGDTLGESIHKGRVDLTDGVHKYMLYRKPSEGADAWVMVDDRTYQPKPLDRESFEAVVLSLLR
jgi:hypothetical protein